MTVNLHVGVETKLHLLAEQPAPVTNEPSHWSALVYLSPIADATDVSTVGCFPVSGHHTVNSFNESGCLSW